MPVEGCLLVLPAVACFVSGSCRLLLSGGISSNRVTLLGAVILFTVLQESNRLSKQLVSMIFCR
jgi:ribose/xylose/arabinose/galactoside ABC-type transport system permease subunit